MGYGSVFYEFKAKVLTFITFYIFCGFSQASTPMMNYTKNKIVINLY